MRQLPVVEGLPAGLAARPGRLVRLLLATEELRLRYGGAVWLTGSGLRDAEPQDWDLRVVLPEAAWREHDSLWWGTESALRSQDMRRGLRMQLDIRVYPDNYWYAGDAARLDGAKPRTEPVPLMYNGTTEENAQAALRTIQEQKDKPEFHVMMGSIMFMRGDKEMAMRAFMRSVELDINFHPGWLNIGNVYFDQKDYKRAAVCCFRAIQIKPDYAKAFCNLANALAQMGVTKQALPYYQRAVRLEPDEAAYHHNMANCLLTMKMFSAARAALERALDLAPADEKVLNTWGNWKTSVEDHYGAAAAYALAIRVAPKYAPLYTNLANVMLMLGYTDEARLNYERGLVLEPRNAGVRYNLALAFLRDGDYRMGWKAYEARFDFSELRTKKRPFAQPLWRGESLVGKRILIHAEQGMGDTFQFCRYVPMVAARGGHVIFEVQHGLQRLMAGVEGVGEIATRGCDLPPFDWHCPLLSLPYLFGTDIGTVPARVPYVVPWQWEVEEMWQRYPVVYWQHGVNRITEPLMRVGISWAGNPKYKADKQRSFSLLEFAALADLEGVRWFSLQKGAHARQIDKYADRIQVIDASGDVREFAESAALMETMDLIITSDTSVAHLAGAMGKLVWVLLAHLPDWRWMKNTDTYPWYPTMRLFRQGAPGDWASAFGKVRQALRQKLDLSSIG